MFRKLFALGAAAATLAACSYVDDYEKAVYDMEPVYCYRTIGGPECHREPSFAARAKLVNYYGPHPSRYDAPEAVLVPEPKAPEMVNYWVKDAEPIPRAAALGDPADRPWLTHEGRAEQQATADYIELKASTVGTQAFLRRIADAAAGPSEGVPEAAPVTPVKVGTF